MPRRIRCVTLDGYGTLLDRERGLREALLAVPALGRSGNLAGRIVSRSEEIEHGLIVSAPDMPDADAPEERYESLPYRPYAEILAESLLLAARDLGCPLTAENAVAAAGSMPRWPLFPDAERALARIRERFPIGLLANAEEDVLAEAISRIGVPFDLVVSAEKVGSYKPSPD